MARLEGHKLPGVINSPVSSTEASRNLEIAIAHAKERDTSRQDLEKFKVRILGGDGDSVREFLTILSTIYKYQSDVLSKNRHRKFRI